MSRDPVDPAPRLFLITPPIADVAAFAPRLEAAVSAADIACVLLRVAATAGDTKAIIRALAPIAQTRGAAVLVEEDSRLATRAEADGVHMTSVGAELKEALAALQPRLIVGCGDLTSRDDAMAAGEAGVDYLMFGGPGGDAHGVVVERVSWWADIFNVPCVGYAAGPDLALEIAEAGAEFVALCDGLWERPDRIMATIRDIDRSFQAVRVPT